MPELKLVPTGEIVQFPKRSTFEEGWASRAGQMKKRGDGREKTRKLWDKAGAKVGHTALLEALRRYLRTEKEPQCGYPGLSVWLNGERYDHWLEPDAPALALDDGRPRLAEPFRSALISLCGEPWVLSYVDLCTVEGTVLIVPAGKLTALAKIRENGRQMKEAGLTAVRMEK